MKILLFVAAFISITLTSSSISMVTHPRQTVDNIKTIANAKKTINTKIGETLKAQQDSIARANGDAKSVSY